ncbi:MFS transporter [Halosaccharopolyspora lacisalsi]|nr:MFS transporter [Halosaccharopolyspora lacisalsi]
MTRTTPVPSTTNKQWFALATLLLPVLLVSVDNTVLGFAVPELSRELRPTGSQLLWIIDIYSLMLAGLLVTVGTLGDRIGRRRLLLIGAAGFGAASILAAFSSSAGMLIAARALQGVAGATLMPSTLSLIRNIFPDSRTRTTAIAAWTATFAGGAAFGPVLGGWLLGHFWWGSVFLINAPVAVLLLIVGPMLIPESRDPAPGRYDVPSAALSLLALLSLVFGIKQLAEHGGSATATAAMIVAVCTTVLFVRRQHRIPAPMLDMQLFANSRFGVAVVSNLLAVFVMVGGLFFITQYLQLVLNLNPLEAGLVLLPGLVLSIPASLVTVRLLRRIRLAELVGASMLCSTLGYLVMTLLPVDGGIGLVVIAFVLTGTGAGIAETATNDVIMSAVPASKAGGASAISETGYELGAAMGTAILGSFLNLIYRSGFGSAPADVTESAQETAHDTLGGAMAVAADLPPAQASALREAAVHAFTHGVHLTSLLGAAIMSYAALQAWWVLRRT